MKILNSVNGNVQCELSKNEILMIKNCLGEICYGIELAEFYTRVGYTREEIDSLVKTFKKIVVDFDIEE